MNYLVNGNHYFANSDMEFEPHNVFCYEIFLAYLNGNILYLTIFFFPQMFNIYIKRAAEIYGVTHTRAIYEKAIEVLIDEQARLRFIIFVYNNFIRLKLITN